MSVVIVNEKQFMAQLTKKLKGNPIKNAKIACQLAADAVRAEAIDSIARGSKSGATVRKSNPSRTHTQSATGQAPATDTGFLISQITATNKRKGTIVFGEVKSSAPYSKPLEFGTRSMGKRPFMQPALDRSADQIKRIFIRQGLINKKGAIK